MIAASAAARVNPLVLAFIVRNVLDGALEGTRQGYRTTRRQLGPLLPPQVIAGALAEFRAEGSRLSDTLRSVN